MTSTGKIDAKSLKTILGLAFVNAIVLVLTSTRDQAINSIVWFYYLQSLFIGALWFARLLALRHYHTHESDKIKSNEEIAFLFLGHYGVMHLVYFFFIPFDFPDGDSVGSLILCGLLLVISELLFFISMLYQDRKRSVYLPAAMMLPYCRIIPIHALILMNFSGDARGLISVSATFWLFAIAKIGADTMFEYCEPMTFKPLNRDD